MAARPIEALRRRLWVDLGLFTLATFALTWLLVGLYIWNADAMPATFGRMKLGAPVFYIAVAAPTIAALLVTAWRYGEVEQFAFGHFLGRVCVYWTWTLRALCREK